VIRSFRRLAAAALVSAISVFVPPMPASAQVGGPGFTFREPRAFVQFHGGYALPVAQSDLFDQTTEDLLIERRDLRGPFVGGELSIRASGRWDVAFGVGHTWSEKRVEWRDFVEEDGSPIWQRVRFSRTPISLSGKYYLADRGRRIGRFVWIPGRVLPFVGAGLGVVRYRFVQAGDFVDYRTLEIYSDDLESEGAAVAAHGFLGLDLGVTRFLYLTTQARYTWARADLDPLVYDGFEPIDLSGFRLVLGIGVRL
jgi:hypothetical protein